MSEYKYTTLTTEYMEQMDKDMPWAEYPRPQMWRESYVLYIFSSTKKTPCLADTKQGKILFYKEFNKLGSSEFDEK